MEDQDLLSTEFASHLRRDWDPDELIEARRAVQEVLDSRGWSVIEKLLKTREERLLTRLIANTILPGKEYAHLTGKIAGIRLAGRAAATLVGVAKEIEQEIVRRAGAPDEEVPSG